ncbi:hypothetical protein SARC_11609 [Sphaeroforma arctica JP610]|uniref:Glycolipid transfer protein domain-containing protein n=1 Tax=Sphaeroforma arctica JP610 TaxID=667725 RepID=A0A0L0FGG6_9EUKA|nr:hypothetical protein SARC_11609 [Sphaeroforma arctica JP610]KNC75874.1 hypothetical protein SARC_11609 [Sphaeroforma arctica JP610]|eukprot:XP_014149776.1 hypothetical protein SARC_11609 [Sphaeroforma arctica JP610]
MQEFCQTMYDVYTCLDTAYAQTLKNFHSFFDRGAVALALRSAPTREDFVLALQPRQFTVDGTVAEAEALLISHMTEYSKGLSAQLAKCKKLFVNLGLKDT